MELALRDVVARAIETEIREGRGYGEGLGAYVLCDVVGGKIKCNHRKIK